jgi:flagellar basal body L-ring protein FlgH
MKKFFLILMVVCLSAGVSYAGSATENQRNESPSVSITEEMDNVLANGSFTITGQVIDKATGEPIQGALVQVRGTTRSTNTDSNGNFSLSEVAVGDTLVISYLGYQVAYKIISYNNQTGVVELEEEVG